MTWVALDGVERDRDQMSNTELDLTFWGWVGDWTDGWADRQGAGRTGRGGTGLDRREIVGLGLLRGGSRTRTGALDRGGGGAIAGTGPKGS